MTPKPQNPKTPWDKWVEKEFGQYIIIDETIEVRKNAFRIAGDLNIYLVCWLDMHISWFL